MYYILSYKANLFYLTSPIRSPMLGLIGEL